MTRELLQIIGSNTSAGLPTSLHELDDLLSDHQNIRRTVKYFESIKVLEWADGGIMMTEYGGEYYDGMKK